MAFMRVLEILSLHRFLGYGMFLVVSSFVVGLDTVRVDCEANWQFPFILTDCYWVLLHAILPVGYVPAMLSLH